MRNFGSAQFKDPLVNDLTGKSQLQTVTPNIYLRVPGSLLRK